MSEKDKKSRLDRKVRQRRIYSAVIIVLSLCMVVSMILQLIAK
ncbi:MAG: hypothetical protein ABWK53_08030 [Anaerolineales bacterium]